MKTIIFSCLLLLTALSTVAQSNFSIDRDSSRISIHGTSTVSDWSIEITDFSGLAYVEAENGALEVRDLKIFINASSIESGKKKMDEHAKEALKAEQFPHILFQLKDVTSNEDGTISAKGNLLLGGVKRFIDVSGSYQSGENTVLIKGKKDISMAEFELDPPKARIGSVDDRVVIDYYIVLK